MGKRKIGPKKRGFLTRKRRNVTGLFRPHPVRCIGPGLQVGRAGPVAGRWRAPADSGRLEGVDRFESMRSDAAEPAVNIARLTAQLVNQSTRQVSNWSSEQLVNNWFGEARSEYRGKGIPRLTS
jgi:hypothetical protein